jgi:hypothetical protein
MEQQLLYEQELKQKLVARVEEELAQYNNQHQTISSTNTIGITAK